MSEVVEAKPPPPWWQRVLVGRDPKRTLVRLAIMVIVLPLLFHVILLPIRVQGASMMPTYRDHGVNFVNRLSYRFHPPRRGDVVAIRTTGFSIMYMKRIIALPGETIEFHHGHTFINGQPLSEPYVKFPWSWEDGPRVLGPNEYYVVGDNRSMPKVDHSEGTAPRERIVGKILL
jgi:signal peptidase I